MHWSPETFARRRARVLDQLEEGDAMVLPAAPEIVVGRDLELPYLVDPDLWYLTGCEAPEAVAVLRPGSETPFTLFLRDRDPDRELWTGPREEVEAAGERLGADAAFPAHALEEELPDLLKGTDTIHFRIGTAPGHVENLVLEILGGGRSARQRGDRGPARLVDPGLILDELRLRKEPEEIEAIRDAVALTITGIEAGLRATRPGAGEWEVEAAVDGVFRRAAGTRAFATIAASGPNATVLHYTRNDRVMAEGDLLLLDAGASLAMYNGDLTRTVPVGGEFQGGAADVHRAVLDAHAAAVNAVAPGATIEGVHRAALEVLVPALVELGLARGDAAGLLGQESAWKRYVPHSTSHWLGLDVHDVGTYARRGAPRPLEPGMVLTVEPGRYIPHHDAEAPDALRGVGVRIEDDVQVTAEGCEVLSSALPTDPAELAALLD